MGIQQPGMMTVNLAFYRVYLQRAWWLILAAVLATPLIVYGLSSLIQSLENVTFPADQIFALVAIFQVTLIPLGILSPAVPWDIQFPLPLTTRRLFFAHYCLVIVLAAVCGWISLQMTVLIVGPEAQWPLWRIWLWILAATSLGCGVNWPLQRSLGLQAIVGLTIPTAFLIRLILLMTHHMEFGQRPAVWFAKFFPHDIILCAVVLVFSSGFALYGLQRARIGEDLRRPRWVTWLAELRARGECQRVSPESALEWCLLQNAGRAIRWGGVVLVIAIFCCHFAVNEKVNSVAGFMAIAPAVMCGGLSVFAGACCGLLDTNHKSVGFPSYFGMLPMTDSDMAKVTTRTFVKIILPALCVTLICILLAGAKVDWAERFPVRFPQPGVPGIVFSLLATVLLTWTIGASLLCLSLGRHPEIWGVAVFYGGVIGVVFEDKFGPAFTIMARVAIWASLLTILLASAGVYRFALRHRLIQRKTMWLALAAAILISAAFMGAIMWHGTLTPRGAVLSLAVAALVVLPVAGVPTNIFRNRHR